MFLKNILIAFILEILVPNELQELTKELLKMKM